MTAHSGPTSEWLQTVLPQSIAARHSHALDVTSERDGYDRALDAFPMSRCVDDIPKRMKACQSQDQEYHSSAGCRQAHATPGRAARTGQP